jgi:hypothetical protein
MALTVLVLSLLQKFSTAPISAGIVQVSFGEAVTLLCESNDQDHVFFYWHFNEQNIVIGPSNKYDIRKYKYQVLSGNLTIRAATKEEEGVYNCVSRGIEEDDINVHSVQVAVLEKEDNISDRNPFPSNKHRWIHREDTATDVCNCDFGSTLETTNENNLSRSVVLLFKF